MMDTECSPDRQSSVADTGSHDGPLCTSSSDPDGELLPTFDQFSSPRAARKSHALMGRISMFEAKKGAGESPTVHRKTPKHRVGKIKSPIPQSPSVQFSALSGRRPRDFKSLPQPPGLDDSASPHASGKAFGVYEGPLRDEHSRDELAATRKSDMQEKLEMFEDRNRKERSSSVPRKGQLVRKTSRSKRLTRQDSDPTLGKKPVRSPLGGRSTDLALSATTHVPRTPRLDKEEDEDWLQKQGLGTMPIKKAVSLAETGKASDLDGSLEISQDRKDLNPNDTEEYLEAPIKRRTWKPKRVISIEEMKSMTETPNHPPENINDGQGTTSDDGEGFVFEMELKSEPSDYSENPIRRKSWKPKRVISVEEMDSRNSEGPSRSRSQGREPSHNWNPQADVSGVNTRIENDGSKMPSDTEASPKSLSRKTNRLHNKLNDLDDARHSWHPKSHTATETNYSEKSPKAAAKKSNKLQDRIDLFNKGVSSSPQQVLLGSRYMDTLVQKMDDGEDNAVSHLPALVEDMHSIIDAPPLATAEETTASSNEELENVSSHVTGNNDNAIEKPRISLDKAVAETKKKQVEKQRTMSIMRRGQVNATRSALVDQKGKDKNAVFANLLVRQEDLASHALPEFAKHPSDKKTILTALRKNFVFEDLEDDDMEKLVAAMEEVKVSKGQEITRQGTEGDYFYVVSKGEVELVVDGRKVATVGPGNGFGEIELLYACPRAATVVAREQPTTLFRVDQKSFRFIMQSETQKSAEEKKKLLQQVPFLSSLGAEDITRLCSVMQPVLFYTGDYIVQKGERGSSFYMIQDGKVRVTEIFVGGTNYEDIVLGKGDYFGEDALVSDEPRAANVVALTTGRAFSIDRENVRKVLGDFASLISKSQDRQKLESMKIFRDGDLESANFDNLAKLITDKKFSENEIIIEQNFEVDASLYIVREGAVKIVYSDGRQEVIGAGGAFGQDQLLVDANGCITPDCRIVATYTARAISACVCGILTLEDCRNTFDTSSLGDRIFSEGNSALEQKRAAMRELMKSHIKLEDLDKDRIIGEGQFGTVWLVRADPNKTNDKSKMLEFAMKVQFKEDDVRRDGAIEAIKREMTVIHQLNHPFIIDLVDKYETDDQLMMLTEAVKGGELWSRIHRESEDGNWTSGMPEAEAKFYALIIADTVAYMHRQKIIFRDLKPENVLIDAEGYPTLCDFGFAKYCPDKTFTFCGTPNYLAPEIVLNRGHGAAVDHWALGIVTYEMITGENPFYYDGQDQISLLQAIVQEEYYPLPATFSNEVISFMSAILEKDPVQRLGSLAGGEKGILKHEWFSDLDINEIRNKKAKAPYIPDVGTK